MINVLYTRDLILDFMTEGYSLDMIADMLELSRETVIRIVNS